MMQNKDEEIIKALDCCTSPKVTEECPRQPKGVTCNDGCEFLLMKDALDLINRQQAEIESLNNLAVYNASCCAKLHKELFNAKSQAVREFAERLKEISDRDGWTDSSEIDNLLKEMTEPVKIEHNSLCETETYKGE